MSKNVKFRKMNSNWHWTFVQSFENAKKASKNAKDKEEQRIPEELNAIEGHPSVRH